MDEKTLYDSVLYREDEETVEEKLNAQTGKPIVTKVMIKFLFLILTLVNFIFNSFSYLQIKGCVMGNICAPSNANIFMEKLN